jgi:hypothetical protein
MIVLAWLATTAPLAHVLEAPNKFGLGGAAWLAVQQTLYRGWGAVFGPVEIAGLLLSASLAVWLRGRARVAMTAAGAAYAAMIVDFFVLNAPVNAAINGWTAARLPADWPAYRWRWEAGHAIAAILALAALLAVTWGAGAWGARSRRA